MSTEFIMPKLGLTMEEGTILEWLVPDGAEVQAGTAVMTIETDKVESEVESNGSGRLRQLGAAGDTFRCGEVIGLLLAEGEEAPGADAQPDRAQAERLHAAPAPAAFQPSTTGHTSASGTDRGGRLFASPNARRVAAARHVDLTLVRGTGPNGRIVSEDVEDAASRSAPSPAVPLAPASRRPVDGSGRRGSYPATAAGRQLADLLGIDLADVAPDPVEGYITRESVARHVRALLQPPVTAAPAAGQAPPAMQEPTSVRKLSGMRGTIAKRMHASLQDMAQLTLTMDADMDAVVADRNARKAVGNPPGFTDYVIAAAAQALRAHPGVNAQVTPDGIARLPRINVGMAVALDEGLVVPVVHDTDRLDLDTIAAHTTRLADAARKGALTLDDLDGGTFSVTALGMFGVDTFTPVINPPNAAILGVGRLRDDLVLVDGAVGTTKRLTLSLTWDHRVFDGAPAAEFCRSIVELLADPARLQTPP